jgi:hypothetical protein
LTVWGPELTNPENVQKHDFGGSTKFAVFFTFFSEGGSVFRVFLKKWKKGGPKKVKFWSNFDQFGVEKLAQNDVGFTDEQPGFHCFYLWGVLLKRGPKSTFFTFFDPKNTIFEKKWKKHDFRAERERFFHFFSGFRPKTSQKRPAEAQIQPP